MIHHAIVYNLPVMKIVLATLHSKYVHSSLSLPYLAATCDPLGISPEIREFTVHEPHDHVLHTLVAAEADVYAFSCYIWNIQQTLRLADDLKKVVPEALIVLGGPEAGFGTFELLERHPAVDCVIRGEGEATFAELVAGAAAGGVQEVLGKLTEGATFRDGDNIVALPERKPIADLDAIPSPFAAGLADLGKPLVYYETSRGCPFSCAFCMSSLEKGVRSFSPERIEQDLLLLMERQVGTVKLVDRTFNYDAARANRIWSFILRHNRGSSFHFEIAADLLTANNIALLATVPAGMFRFEIGIQSENPATLARVGRTSDLQRLLANVERLRTETGVTLHLDLVAGLPHEDYPGFLDSLQTLLRARPHHIQIEPLKVLKGSPMRRIARTDGYAFSDHPPYKILRSPWLTFAQVTRIETIARLVDVYYNSGRFAATLTVIGELTPLSRFFADFARFWEGEHDGGSLSLSETFERLYRFLRSWQEGQPAEQLRDALCFDYCRCEYPVAGRLPTFFPPDAAAGQGERDSVKELLRRCPVPSGSRVRTFVAAFARDHRLSAAAAGPVRVVFIYISTAGKKMEVRLLQF